MYDIVKIREACDKFIDRVDFDPVKLDVYNGREMVRIVILFKDGLKAELFCPEMIMTTEDFIAVNLAASHQTIIPALTMRGVFTVEGDSRSYELDTNPEIEPVKGEPFDLQHPDAPTALPTDREYFESAARAKTQQPVKLDPEQLDKARDALTQALGSFES